MLEDELQELHQAYVSRVRNMHYLQTELKKIDRREARAAKRAEDKRLPGTAGTRGTHILQTWMQ